MEVEAEEEYLTDLFSQLLPVIIKDKRLMIQFTLMKTIFQKTYHQFYFLDRYNQIQIVVVPTLNLRLQQKTINRLRLLGIISNACKCLSLRLDNLSFLQMKDYIQIRSITISVQTIIQQRQLKCPSCIQSRNEVGFLTITQDQLTLDPDIIKIDQSFDGIPFRKIGQLNTKIINFNIISLKQIKSFLLQNRIKQRQCVLNFHNIIMENYHNLKVLQKEQIQQQGKLVSLMLKNTLFLSRISTDNTLMISSTYGHLYTFNLGDLKLMNLFLVAINIGFRYQNLRLMCYGQYLNLFKNTRDWRVNKPYLSLESIFIYQSDCIALFQQNGIINILYLNESSYVINLSSMIEYSCQFPISQKNPYSILFIAALDCYTYDSINTVKTAPQGHETILINAFLGTLVIIGIIKSLYMHNHIKKKIYEIQNKYYPQSNQLLIKQYSFIQISQSLLFLFNFSKLETPIRNTK